jgi:hypothetical protein
VFSCLSCRDGWGESGSKSHVKNGRQPQARQGLGALTLPAPNNGGKVRKRLGASDLLPLRDEKRLQVRWD